MCNNVWKIGTSIPSQLGRHVPARAWPVKVPVISFCFLFSLNPHKEMPRSCSSSMCMNYVNTYHLNSEFVLLHLFTWKNKIVTHLGQPEFVLNFFFRENVWNCSRFWQKEGRTGTLCNQLSSFSSLLVVMVTGIHLDQLFWTWSRGWQPLRRTGTISNQL